MSIKASISLDHKTGPVVITIEAQTPEVAAYLANSIKRQFSKPQATKPNESMDDFVERILGGKRNDMMRGLGL